MTVNKYQTVSYHCATVVAGDHTKIYEAEKNDPVFGAYRYASDQIQKLAPKLKGFWAFIKNIFTFGTYKRRIYNLVMQYEAVCDAYNKLGNMNQMKSELLAGRRAARTKQQIPLPDSILKVVQERNNVPKGLLDSIKEIHHNAAYFLQNSNESALEKYDQLLIDYVKGDLTAQRLKVFVEAAQELIIKTAVEDQILDGALLTLMFCTEMAAANGKFHETYNQELEL